MPLTNIKRRESVPGQGIAKLKRREQTTVYSIRFHYRSPVTESFSVWNVRQSSRHLYGTGSAAMGPYRKLFRQHLCWTYQNNARVFHLLRFIFCLIF